MQRVHQAFTMIEVVFVIVIMGILSSIAMKKLSTNMTDAKSVMCVSHMGEFISSATLKYTQNGHTLFKELKASDMTNILTFNGAVPSGANAFKNTKVDTEGVDYYCDGYKIATFLGQATGSHYLFIVAIADTSTIDSPVAQSAAIEAKKNILNGEQNKTFSL